MDRLTRRLFVTARRIRERFDAELALQGGSVQQWLVLRSLSEAPRLSHRELAECIDLTGPTLTHHIDRMEAQGLITRTRDVLDRRVVHIALTEAGSRRFVELDLVAQRHDAQVRAILGPADSELLGRLLSKLQLGLTDADEGEPRAS